MLHLVWHLAGSTSSIRVAGCPGGRARGVTTAPGPSPALAVPGSGGVVGPGPGSGARDPPASRTAGVRGCLGHRLSRVQVQIRYPPSAPLHTPHRGQLSAMAAVPVTRAVEVVSGRNPGCHQTRRIRVARQCKLISRLGLQPCPGIEDLPGPGARQVLCVGRGPAAAHRPSKLRRLDSKSPHHRPSLIPRRTDSGLIALGSAARPSRRSEPSHTMTAGPV